MRQAINDTLRMGLLGGPPRPAAGQFRIRPKHMGVRPGLSYDNIESLLEMAEGGFHR